MKEASPRKLSPPFVSVFGFFHSLYCFFKSIFTYLKLLIALFYFYRPTRISERIRDVNEKQIMEALEKNWPATPSYEYLGIVFDKSKATIHEAIKEKETQAKQLIEEGQLKREAKAIALKELIEEEKQKLRLERENNQRNSQTTEQTPITP